MVDVAICGQRVRFCRMLELELESMGFSVAWNPRGGNARLWIVDPDTAPFPAGADRCIIAITERGAALTEEQRAACYAVYERPIRMSELRRSISELLGAGAVYTARAVLCRTQASGGFELNGERLALSEAEEMILQALYDRRGEVVPRAELCAMLKNETNPKLADVYICLLRRKLEAGGTPRMLFTVRGIGYRLENET